MPRGEYAPIPVLSYEDGLPDDNTVARDWMTPEDFYRQGGLTDGVTQEDDLHAARYNEKQAEAEVGGLNNLYELPAFIDLEGEI